MCVLLFTAFWLSPPLFQYFADRDMFCAGRVPDEDLQRTMKSCGGAIQSTVHDLNDETLATCETFEEKQVRHFWAQWALSRVVDPDPYGSIFIFLPGSGSAYWMRIRILEGKVEKNRKKQGNWLYINCDFLSQNYNFLLVNLDQLHGFFVRAIFLGF